MKITKSQLKQIIAEEAAKFKKAIALKNELAKIDKQLSEVKAGGVMATDGVHAGQRKAEFTKKGTHLIEDEELDFDDTDNSSDDMISKSEVEAAIKELEANLLGGDDDMDMSDMEIEDSEKEEEDMEIEFGDEDVEDEDMKGETEEEEETENETEEAEEEETEEEEEPKALNEERERMRKLAGIITG
jgi:hypothetical protein